MIADLFKGTERDGLEWAISRWTVADYGLALASTPKILTYASTSTRTSRRWHGMQQEWPGSGYLGIKDIYIYEHILM